MRIPLRHARIIIAGCALVAAAGLQASHHGTAYAADGLSLQFMANVNKPVAIVNAHDNSNRLFIVDQEGVIRIWNGTQILPTPFLDISTPVLCCNEQGLLGLAFDPNYENNGYFYVNYIMGGPVSIISRFHVSADPNVADANSETILKQVARPAANHNGGNLAFGPDGYLYFGMGDSGGGGDPGEVAQDVNSLLGKIWRLDVNAPPNYIPASNPLVNQPGADEIWAMGLRNPWRFSFDRVTGDLFIADVGQGAREEVDFQAAGSTTFRNYGWDNMEGSICFEPMSGCITTGMTLPVLEYDHSLGCSITGGFRYRGPEGLMYGHFFYGDYCSGRIWDATFNGSSWTSTQTLLAGFMITTFGEGEDGSLYVGDYNNGRLLKVLPAPDLDLDGVLNAADNCVNVANANQLDSDGDLLGDACETAFGAVNGDTDSDDDGCIDGREARIATFGPSQGGHRSPSNPWDFFDVTGDRAIDLQDTLSVLQYFGTNGSTPASNLRDRFVPDLGWPWRSAEANNGVDLADALANLKSFGAFCS